MMHSLKGSRLGLLAHAFESCSCRAEHGQYCYRSYMLSPGDESTMKLLTIRDTVLP